MFQFLPEPLNLPVYCSALWVHKGPLGESLTPKSTAHPAALLRGELLTDYAVSSSPYHKEEPPPNPPYLPHPQQHPPPTHRYGGEPAIRHPQDLPGRPQSQSRIDLYASPRLRRPRARARPGYRRPRERLCVRRDLSDHLLPPRSPRQHPRHLPRRRPRPHRHRLRRRLLPLRQNSARV